MHSKNTKKISNHRVDVNIDKKCKTLYPHLQELLINIITIALNYIQIKELNKNFEISVRITNDKKIKQINKTYRNKDKATDVLSFSQLEGMEFPELPDEPLILGDIIISYETAIKQALELGHSVEYEFIRLIVHGIYHLLGYDHERSKEEEKIMSRKEAQMMKYISKRIQIQ